MGPSRSVPSAIGRTIACSSRRQAALEARTENRFARRNAAAAGTFARPTCCRVIVGSLRGVRCVKGSACEGLLRQWLASAPDRHTIGKIATCRLTIAEADGRSIEARCARYSLTRPQLSSRR